MAVTGFLSLAALGSGPTLTGLFSDFPFDTVNLPTGVTVTQVEIRTSWNLSSLVSVSHNFWCQSDTRGGGGHQFVCPATGGPNPYATSTIPELDATTPMTRAAFLNERFF